MKPIEKQKQELELIREQNGGVLRPQDVVAFAADPTTALHERFTWDDTKAAQEYRLWQAREVIRVSVTVVGVAKTETRAYVSLNSDRKRPGGGYRTIADVLSDDDKTEELLNQALADMRRFREKYESLSQLSGVMNAILTFENSYSRDSGLAVANA